MRDDCNRLRPRVAALPSHGRLTGSSVEQLVKSESDGRRSESQAGKAGKAGFTSSFRKQMMVGQVRVEAVFGRWM